MTNFYDINKNEELLKIQLSYVVANSPFYKKRFTDCKIDIEGIPSYEEFRKIPITTKEDLQHYNQEFIAVPKDEVADTPPNSTAYSTPQPELP